MKEKKTRGPKYDRDFLVKKLSMMRIKGKSTRFLIEFLEETVGLAKSTAYEVLGDAQKLVTEMQDKKIEDAYADAIAKLEEEYENTSDRKIRLQIQQELNKLQGLYKPSRIDVTSGGDKFRPDEIVIKIIDSKSGEEM